MWTAPPTALVSDALTASWLNTYVRDNTNALRNFDRKFYYTGNTAGGSATSATAILTQNAITSFDETYTMLVDFSIQYGFSGGSPVLSIDVTDEAGAVISAGFINGATLELSQTGAEKNVGALRAKKQYAANATCGFRFRYWLNTSNIYLYAHAEVTFVQGWV